MTKPLAQITHVYLIGIGGIGMSALARWFKHKGLEVAGYDKTPSDLTAQLENEGMVVTFDEGVEAIPAQFTHNRASTLIIVTPAVPQHHLGLRYFLENGFRVMKRSEVLGLISQEYHTLAVAGTHGKTTTSSILAHLLAHQGPGCNAFLGGIAANSNSNLIIDANSRLMVVEADEYDRSFLQLSPVLSVVTSVDPDHLDIYGTEDEMRRTYEAFVARLGAGRTLVRKKGLPIFNHPTSDITYAVEDKEADFNVRDLSVANGLYHFTLVTPDGPIANLTFGMPGRHNLENAVAASAAAIQNGLRPDALRSGLATYCGVKRRFETVLRTEKVLFIDDYAHHPTELQACIRSVRELNPGRHITGVFQPHLFSRTRDLAEGFAQSLAELDRLLLLDIYPARELPIEGITSGWLLNQVNLNDKRLVTKTELPDLLAKLNVDVLLTLGAGDIDRLVAPIRQKLQSA